MQSAACWTAGMKPPRVPRGTSGAIQQAATRSAIKFLWRRGTTSAMQAVSHLRSDRRLQSTRARVSEGRGVGRVSAQGEAAKQGPVLLRCCSAIPQPKRKHHWEGAGLAGSLQHPPAPTLTPHLSTE